MRSSFSSLFRGTERKAILVFEKLSNTPNVIRIFACIAGVTRSDLAEGFGRACGYGMAALRYGHTQIAHYQLV